MSELRVVSAVADKKKATLYLEDGRVETIDQRDHRLAEIMDQIIPIIAKGEVAVIKLETLSVYADFQEKSSSLVRFFKVAKSKVKHMLGLDEEPSATSADGITTLKEALERKFIDERKEAAESLLKEMKPLDSDTVLSTETIVAVTADNKIIPQMENLKEYFIHAKRSGNTVGMDNFLKRVSTMIGKYDHSVEDILRFMEKGDLPVANDGSIVAYKILRKTKDEGVFVDCHSGNVKQKVGSYVVVDPSMVDRNRRNECSNGLHIARRGYLGSFSGDVCVLVKLAPEDVVTVPHNDPNKVRVCGYHILSVLPQESFQKLRANTPMTSNPEAAKQLEAALTGNHIAKLEEVRITKPYGGGLQITPWTKVKRKDAQETEAAPVKAVAFDDAQAGSVDPKTLAKKMAEEEEALSKTVAETAEAAAQEVVKEDKASKPVATQKPTQSVYLDLWDKAKNGDKNAADELLSRKKKAKKSWTALGLPENAGTELEGFSFRAELEAASKPKAEPKKVQDKPAPKAKNTKVSPPSLEGKSNKEKVRALYDHWIVTLSSADKDALFAVKKSAKVSWTKLGLTDAEIAQLEK